ncbi:MAG TPA: class I SAM-dependent methyltransferase [Methylomirabilota bacterium]|nr:class I SAM-dependent methyltransferase [Methylomirabilota bacterium]
MSDSQQGRVQAQFGPSAAAYVTSAGHAAGPDLEWLLAWGRKRGAARVLDIATGGGHTALAFSRFTESVVAMDVTLPMLEAARRFIAREGAAVRFVGGDVETLPFRDATFGTVTCRIAAHHFPALLPALRQVARVLRAGGTFLIQDILGHDDQDAAAFIREVERRRDPSHVRAYRQLEWTAFLRAAGLTVLDETVMSKVRPWDEWTTRMRMTPEARADLERFVLAAPAHCRDAFDFRIEDGRIVSFTDRMLLLRADRD